MSQILKMSNFIKIIASMTVLALLVLSSQIVSSSLNNQALKSDFAGVNHIQYGLFSVDAWKKQLEAIVQDEISQFDFTKSNEKELKKQVQVQLGVLIDKVESRIHAANEGSLKGKIRQAFINSVVDMNEIKKGIPEYSDAILAELKKAKTERKLKKVVKKEVSKYFNKTYDTLDHADLDRILARAGTDDIEQAKGILADRIAATQKLLDQYSMLTIGLAIFLFVLIGAQRKELSPFEYICLVFTLLLLLAVGVTTPMIDMEAKISSMSFMLLDHEIMFQNQILYFQSKSILDVFLIMIRHHEIQMKLVGVLVITFSIVFPICKLFSTGVYYFNYRGARTSHLVEFFVKQSGKWSMSDVLVVAIFMAYVGFNGIISSQLGRLKELAGEIQLVTTNGTTLQPGFYLFLTYVLLGLTLSLLITRGRKRDSSLTAA